MRRILNHRAQHPVQPGRRKDDTQDKCRRQRQTSEIPRKYNGRSGSVQQNEHDGQWQKEEDVEKELSDVQEP
jgi:hypothetical protein